MSSSVDQILSQWENGLKTHLEVREVSPFSPSAKDFNLEYQRFFENKELFDFEIKTFSDEEPIKVHRIYLIIKGFENLKKSDQKMIKINANREMVETLINGYYYRNFDLKIDANNVDEYIGIADQFGNEELFNYLMKRKEDLDLIQFQQYFNEFKTSVKRKNSFRESLPSKVFKTSDKSEANGCQPIPGTNLTNNLKDSSPNDDQCINKSKDKPRVVVIDIDDNNCETTEEKAVTEDREEINQQNNDSITEEKGKCLTTEITKFIPDSDEETTSSDIKIIDKKTKQEMESEVIRRECKPMDSNGSDTEIQLLSQSMNNSESSQPSGARNQTFNYTKLLGSIQTQNANSLIARVESLQKRELRMRNNVTPVTPQKTESHSLRYKIQKFVSHTQKSKSTQVWKSKFVPKMVDEKHMVVVVGGKQLNWYNLDQLHSTIEPTHVFNSPNGESLRSIAVCGIDSPSDEIIYAIGSEGCLFIFKHPTDKNVDTFERIESYVKKDEDVMDLVFKITADSILLFYGTSNGEVVKSVINMEGTGPLKIKSSLLYSTLFPIISMAYIEKYDSLIICGESRDLIVLKDVSTQDKKPIVGKITPKANTISISSVVYIKERDLLGFRSVNYEYLQTAPLNKMMEHLKPQKSQKKSTFIPFFIWDRLEYKKSQIGSELIEYIEMTSNGGLIACGDAFGNFYVYDCNSLSSTGKSTIKPDQVIGYNWLSPLPIIRSVSVSDDLKYIVGTTNNNLIVVLQNSPD